MKLTIKVVPGSSQERIAGWLGDELKIKVRQVAEHGKANEAVRHLLSKTLELPVGNIRIVSGSASAHKIVEILGLDEIAVHQKVSA